MSAIVPGFALTMTSLEISELVESNHADVRRSIDRLASRGVIQLPPMAKVENKQSLSPNKMVDAYIFEGQKGKRDSMVVVAQLCPEFTAKIVDRWQELEDQVSKPQLPDFSNPAIAARAWADKVEALQIVEAKKAELEHKVEVLAPKADALDRVSAGKDTLTATEASKVLSVKRADLTARMHAEGWWYRQNGSWVAYDRYIKNGCLQYKEANYTDEKTGMSCIKPYCHITPKGLVKLALMLGVTLPANDSNMELSA